MPAPLQQEDEKMVGLAPGLPASESGIKARPCAAGMLCTALWSIPASSTMAALAWPASVVVSTLGGFWALGANESQILTAAGILQRLV